MFIPLRKNEHIATFGGSGDKLNRRSYFRMAPVVTSQTSFATLNALWSRVELKVSFNWTWKDTGPCRMINVILDVNSRVYRVHNYICEDWEAQGGDAII